MKNIILREYIAHISLSIAITLVIIKIIFHYKDGELVLNTEGVSLQLIVVIFLFFGVGIWNLIYVKKRRS